MVDRVSSAFRLRPLLHLEATPQRSGFAAGAAPGVRRTPSDVWRISIIETTPRAAGPPLTEEDYMTARSSLYRIRLGIPGIQP